MHAELKQARENLKKKLLENANRVIKEVLEENLDGLIEIGLFGSLVKGNFTGKSDSDIYLLFDKCIPGRETKGHLRTVAEENNCDIVFLKGDDFVENSLLAKNISKSRIVLWRKTCDDKK